MRNRLRAPLVHAFSVLITLGLGAGPAAALSCGEVLTADTTLDADLACAGTALVIGADDIKLDLNGHALSGDGTGIGVDATAGFGGLRIMNGAVENFERGVRVDGADDVRIEGLQVSGGGWGIDVFECTQVRIADCSVSGADRKGINVYETDGVLVESVHVTDCAVGADFSSCGPDVSCPSVDEQSPTNGKLRDSVFERSSIFGVVLANNEDFVVEDNRIIGPTVPGGQGIRVANWTVAGGITPTGIRILRNEVANNWNGIFAVRLAGEPLLPISGLRIEGNQVSGSFVQGLGLVNVQDSRIASNRVEGSTLFGMRLLESSSGNRITGNTFNDNGQLGLQLRGIATPGPSGNTISHNTALGNGTTDLIHTPDATPNDWRDNCFETSSGADIGAPACVESLAASAPIEGPVRWLLRSRPDLRQDAARLDRLGGKVSLLDTGTYSADF